MQYILHGEARMIWPTSVISTILEPEQESDQHRLSEMAGNVKAHQYERYIQVSGIWLKQKN